MGFNHIKLLRFLETGNKTIFDVPKEQQEAYIASLGDANSDIERSYKQYLCQNFFSSKGKIAFLNFVAHLLFFPVLVILLIAGLRLKRANHIDALTIDLKGMEEIIPDILNERYQIQMNKWSVKGGLRIRDIPYIVSIYFSHWMSGYFSIKALIKIAQYSQMITMFSPRCIIAHSEYSFSSSVLTNYCNQRGVKHINVQHGEKLYNIRDSFFRFDECFVWDSHYKDLFIKLRAEPGQFIISVPNSLQIDLIQWKKGESFSDFKYYLSTITEEEIQKIVESTRFIKEKNKTIKYRLHPRHVNLQLAHKYLKEDEIEYPQLVPILESVASCDHVIGSYSTVLIQAFFSGKEVILDDVTYLDQYKKLEKLDYILSSKDCHKLSSLKS